MLMTMNLLVPLLSPSRGVTNAFLIQDEDPLAVGHDGRTFHGWSLACSGIFTLSVRQPVLVYPRLALRNTASIAARMSLG